MEKRKIFIWLFVLASVSPLFAESILTKEGNIYVGDVLEKKSMVSMQLQMIYIKKENIETQETLTSDAGKIYMKVKLKDGSSFIGFVTRDARGNAILSGNPYLKEKFKIEKENIQAITDIKKITVKLKNGKTITGNLTNVSNEYASIENLSDLKQPVQIALAEVVKIEQSVLPFQEIEAMLTRVKTESEKNNPLNNTSAWGGRISLFGGYQHSLSSFSSVLPHGFGILLAYDQSLTKLLHSSKMYLPSIRFELGYTQIFNKSHSISGFLGQAGPFWILNPFAKHNGQFVVSTLFGILYEKIVSDGFNIKGLVPFYSTLIIGYEYNFRILTYFLHLRSSFIYDPKTPLFATGASLGVLYRFQ